MAVSPLALKLIGAGAVAVPAVSIGVVYRENITNFFKNEKKEEISPDQELIKILEKDNQDIVFDVKKSGSTTKLAESELNFSSNKETIVVSIKISEENKTNLKGIDSISQLRNVNSSSGVGRDWSWECQIELNRVDDSGSVSELADKAKLSSSSSTKGFFDILFEDLTDGKNSSNKNIWKKAKIKFIESCSKEKRQWNGNKLTSTIKFDVKKGTETTEVNKLYFKDTNAFEELFILPLKLNEKDEELIKSAEGNTGVQFTLSKIPENADFSNFNQSKITTTFNFTAQQSDNVQWTWECVINFTKGDGAASQTNLKDDQKNILITQDSNTGFFDKLKSAGTENKKLKSRFIKNCALERLSSSTSETNKITSTKTFTLSNDNNNLKINQKEFDKWFKNPDNDS